jgi:hypothetical protein
MPSVWDAGKVDISFEHSQYPREDICLKEGDNIGDMVSSIIILLSVCKIINPSDILMCFGARKDDHTPSFVIEAPWMISRCDNIALFVCLQGYHLSVKVYTLMIKPVLV